MPSDELFEETSLDKAILLQDGLIATATGGNFNNGNDAYGELRKFFASRTDTKTMLPDFVKRCRDLSQFWGFIKFEKSTYAERRNLIWEAFRPLIEYLEANEQAPGVTVISETLEIFDTVHVNAIWQKALDRRIDDPDGAITAARTLLETVCKYILDEVEPDYSDDSDLPKLWALVAKHINLAPNQHQETVFKAILGNCQSVVNNLGAIRNSVGDAHGQGRRSIKPNPRHAELAVNLAGTMASFLVATWNERKNLST